MTDNAEAMHRDFPRWYAAISVGDNAERRSARWTSISALAAKPDRALVEALIRLAFATRQPPSNQALNKIHEALREQDDTFEPKEASREIEVLAGACLHLLLERTDDIGAEAALSVTTTAFVGGRAPNLPIDLIQLAEVAIERMADANRTRPNLHSLMNSESPKFDFEAASAKAREANWEAVAQAFTLAAHHARGALKMLATRQAKALGVVERFLRVQDEELQMLWWLIGGRSSDFDCAFEAVIADGQSLVFAKELADNTALLPGPRSIKPLLTRAGLRERRKITVAAAINAADPKWMSGLVEDHEISPVTLPLHFAIQRQLEAGGGETWVPNWAAVVTVNGGRQLPTLSLAVQFYRERLLVLFQ